MKNEHLESEGECVDVAVNDGDSNGGQDTPAGNNGELPEKAEEE